MRPDHSVTCSPAGGETLGPCGDLLRIAAVEVPVTAQLSPVDRNEYHLSELQLVQDVSHPRRVLPRIQSQHRRILDVGCGAGQTLIGCGIPTHIEAFGVDIDESALALGRRLTERVTFSLARAERLPFKDGSFDLVVCRVAMPYMRMSPALGEMSRVLKPGGDLWVTLHSVWRALKELKDAIVARDAKYIGTQVYALANGTVFHFSGREFHMPFRPKRWESFQTEKSFRTALARAGFTRICIDRSRGTFVVQARRREDVH